MSLRAYLIIGAIAFTLMSIGYLITLVAGQPLPASMLITPMFVYLMGLIVMQRRAHP